MNASVQKSIFGKLPNGQGVDLYTITNANGIIAKVITYGTIITELHVPDSKGISTDVVLGFDNLDQYLVGHPYFGATVGRVANRTAKGRFTLDGKDYQLAINNGPNHLHGGLKGFDKALWAAQPLEDSGVRFLYRSPDGEDGYPGNLNVLIDITLSAANALHIDYVASTDKPTPVNLTNHSYFNLAGKGDILGHELLLAADAYTPVDATSIPTGEIKPVKGTPMDFTTPQTIGSRISQVRGERIGYDHNYVINGGGKDLVSFARVREPISGRVMEAFTTQPGVQFYTGNYLDGSLKGKKGQVYQQHAGFCLETQHFPDSLNHPKFPPIVLWPGQTYRQTTVYKFL